VLAYRLSGDGETSVAVESKSGHSTFSDLWKLIGLKHHLNIGFGVLFADSADSLHEDKREIGQKHDICVIDQSEAGIAGAYANANLIPAVPQPAVLEAWQHCFRVEDSLIRILQDKERWGRYETIRTAKRQLQHLSSAAWVEPDPWKQAAGLYQLYYNAPRIARNMAKELSPQDPDGAFQDAIYEGEHPEIQACFYLEHRKRLALAFAAARCAAIRPKPGMWGPNTPASFREMVGIVREKEAWLLPALLQVYLLGFGGMICLDAEADEYSHLGEQVGCDREEASALLCLFEELFPYPSGGRWFLTSSELARLKLMPVALRGAGIRMREALYALPWSDLATPDQWRICGRDHLKHASRAEQMLARA
jgi:hypothetical protein